MPKKAGSKDWTAAEIHCLALGYNDLLQSGSLSQTEQNTKMFAHFDNALRLGKEKWADPAAMTFFSKLTADAKGSLAHYRSSTSLLDRYKKIDLVYMRNKLNVFWQAIYTESEPEGSTGTQLEDSLRLIKVMAWLDNRMAKLMAKTKKQTFKVAAYNAHRGTLADDDEAAALDRENHVERRRFSDKELCCGLTEDLMAVAGASREALGKVGMVDAFHIFEDCAADIDSGWEPLQWRAWEHCGPPAVAADQLPHLNELNAATDDGDTRVGRAHLRSEAGDRCPERKKAKNSPNSDEAHAARYMQYRAIHALANSGLQPDQLSHIVTEMLTGVNGVQHL